MGCLALVTVCGVFLTGRLRLDGSYGELPLLESDERTRLTLIATNGTVSKVSFQTDYAAARDGFDSAMRSVLRLDHQPPYWYVIMSSTAKPLVMWALFPADENNGEKTSTTVKTLVFCFMSLGGFFHDMATVWRVLFMELPIEDPWGKVHLYALWMASACFPNSITMAILGAQLFRFSPEKAKNCYGMLWVAYALIMGVIYGPIVIFFYVVFALNVLIHTATSIFWTAAWVITFFQFPSCLSQAETNADFMILGVMVMPLCMCQAASLGAMTGRGVVAACGMMDDLRVFMFQAVLLLQLVSPVCARVGVGESLYDAIVGTWEDRHIAVLDVVMRWLQAVNYII